MTISVTFDPPLPSDSPSVFNSKAFTLLGDLNTWTGQANTLAADVNQDEVALAAAVSSAESSAATASWHASTATTQAGIATTQAGTATTKAGEASASATTASTQAGIATAKAGEASTSATNASNSATAAANSASTALSSATSTATAAASAAVAAATAPAAASASAAAASAVQANTAKDLAISAWAASTAPAEQLSAMSQTVHYGTLVKFALYDTSKDSDGGAWRKKCQDKSWYTETLGGDRWIGQQASIAAAWTAAGSATGAVFQATATAGPLTSGKYYAATSSTTATEVFRGITRDFPAMAGLALESARLVIYDMAAPGAPMAFVFTVAGAIPSGASSITAANGAIYYASSTSGVFKINFLTDDINRFTTSGTSKFSGNISQRITVATYGAFAATGAIVNNTVNDCAITVLPSAPIDPATGLPTPTIAVATAGGVSVIKDDGSVVNITATSYTISTSIRFNVNKVFFTLDGNAAYGRNVHTY